MPEAAYAYDAFGRRVFKDLAATPGAVHYHYDPDGRLLAESADTGMPEREYVWLPLDGQAWALPLVLISDADTASPRIHYLHTDHLGTPVAMTSGNLGQLEWSAIYKPFGEAYATTGIGDIALRFPGQLLDPETGFHQNGFRDYDPRLGRYLQSDPIGLAGGLNTYAYVDGDPLNLIDPEGLLAARCVMAPYMPGCTGPELGRGGVPAAPGAIDLAKLLAGLARMAGELCPLPDWFHNESAEDRNPAQDKKLSPGEIKKLKERGVDPEELKDELFPGEGGKNDLYKDKKGNIYVKPKGGRGPGEPAGLNINDL